MTAIPRLRVDSVRKVFDDGRHDAFTDLCRFQGRLYLTCRSCPDGHMVFASARIVVLASDDGGAWEEVFTFSVPGRDTRDPHFLVFQDRLFVYTGAWLVPPEGAERDLNDHLGYGVWSADGRNWNGPFMLEGTYGHYIWRAAAHGRAPPFTGWSTTSCARSPNFPARAITPTLVFWPSTTAAPCSPTTPATRRPRLSTWPS